MGISLERGAGSHMAQLMPLPLTVSCCSKIQIGLPFWYWLTRVVLEKGSLNLCMYVRVISRSASLGVIWRSSCSVQWAEPQEEPDAETMAKVQLLVLIIHYTTTTTSS